MNANAPAVAPELTVVDQDLGPDAKSVVQVLATLLEAAGRATDSDALVDAVMAREELGSTALPGGLAMPHARTDGVATLSVAIARLPEPISWAAGSEPVRVVLLVAAPGDDSSGYLGLVQKLATACVKAAFLDDLAAAATPADLTEVVAGAVGQK